MLRKKDDIVRRFSSSGDQVLDAAQLKQDHERHLPLLSRLREEALFILERALKEADIKYTPYSRIKGWESILAKAERKRLPKPLEDIHDLVGLRIVCLFLSDIPRIGDLIRRSFDVVSEDDKIEGYDAASFGYMSLHLVARLNSQCSGPRYDGLNDMLFEIQVRTIAMDAWANISHHLDYKTEADIPAELRRDFYAVNGLFYVADKHFELFFQASRRSRQEAKELFAQPELPSERKIDLDSLSAYMLTRFPGRIHCDVEDVSDLIEELTRAGYKSIQEVEDVVVNAWSAFERYEELNPPSDVSKYADVGVVRGLMTIADSRFRDARGLPSVAEYTEFEKYVQP